MEHYNAVTLLGLNRPAKRNALNPELIEALRKELKIFESNESSTVAVLYGTGGNFCAGIDLDTVPLDQSNHQVSSLTDINYLKVFTPICICFVFSKWISEYTTCR